MNLFSEFGIADILLLLNYFRGIKQNKLTRRSNRLALTIALLQESDQHEIIDLLKQIKEAQS